MSQRKPKRPSSARHNIKYETFSQFVSSTRLRHIQSLLDDKHSSSTKPDSILCIIGICQLHKSFSIGIDSRYNDGNFELVNYLLFGFFDVRKAELERSGFDDEVIDDVMILIHKSSVDVYCNPINYHYLLPYVSHWQNITFHCLTEDEYKDEEAGENFKIKSLITMVTGCRKIGIPYSSAARPQTFDKFIIEKWPIVQAYALENFGSGGFFTMNNEVVDVSSSVRQLYSLIDPVSLEVLVTRNLPMLEKQWNNMTSTVGMELSAHPGSLEEETVLESLKTYFNHGRTGTECAQSSKQPFVLFGAQATGSNLNKVCTTAGKTSGEVKPDVMGGQTSHTMIIQAVAPKCPLTCTRTYFFTPVYDPFREVNRRNIDVENLMTIYRGMVAAVVAGIHTYARTLSITQAKSEAMGTLHAVCKNLKTLSLLNYISERSNVNFTIEAIDNVGKCKCLEEGVHNLQIKVATLSIYDVPSVEIKGKTLGSLVFAESFLDSVLFEQDPGSPSQISSEVLLLTTHIPRILLWNFQISELTRNGEIQKLLHLPDIQKFGQQLMSGEKVDITTGTPLTLRPDEYQLFMYEHGLIVFRPECGAVAVHGSHIKSVCLYDGESPSQVLLLIIEMNEFPACSLPSYLQSDINTLVLIVRPRSKARRILLSTVLPEWKKVEDCKVPAVEHLDTLPDNLQSLQEVLQVKYQETTGSGLDEMLTQTMTLKKATMMLPSLNNFVAHFKVSSAGFPRLATYDLQCCLKQISSAQPPASDKLIVTILSGIPGSHKEQLCRKLTSLAQDNIRWIVLSPPRYDVRDFDAESLQKSLETAHTTYQKLTHAQNQTRVLIVTAGFTDTVDVVHAIVNHPNKDVAATVTIGAISVCVDPLNTFMEHRWTFPVLLNQCAQGWVNCIIFMSSTETRNELLDHVQNLVRSINSDVALLVADKAVISRSTDLDLILSDSNFMQPAMIRSRLLLNPGWNEPSYKNTFSHPMTNVCLKFSKSLEKVKLVNRLHGLKRSLSEFPFKGNIYFVEGTVLLSDSSQPVDVQFVTLTSYLTIHPADVQNTPPPDWTQSCYMVFTGCDLEESQLKDWLRTCAKQKPQKKKLIDRKDLTQEEINRIHKQHHLETLPAGWFYSGTHFVSMSGDKSLTHPKLEEFLDSWLKTKNEEISKYNAKIDAENFVDLFA